MVPPATTLVVKLLLVMDKNEPALAARVAVAPTALLPKPDCRELIASVLV